jgi:hypothetical protein
VVNVISGDFSEEWAAVVAADKRYEEALAAIPAASLSGVLTRALDDGGSLYSAIRILEDAAPELTASVIPAVCEVLLESRSMPDQARELIFRLPRSEWFPQLEALTGLVIGDPARDYWPYRRLGETLEAAGAGGLLVRLAAAAWQSEDQDILDFAFDYTPPLAAGVIFSEVPRPGLLRGLEVLTDFIVGDSWRGGCDYRQLGELLREAGAADLLSRLLATARQSEKPDILKFAADFPSESGAATG